MNSAELRLRLLPSLPPSALVENLLRGGWRFEGLIIPNVDAAVVKDVGDKATEEIVDDLFDGIKGSGRVASFSMVHATSIGGEFIYHESEDLLQFSPTINRIRISEGYSDVTKYLRLICVPLSGLFVSWMWDEEAR